MKAIKRVIFIFFISIFIVSFATGCSSKKGSNEQLEVRLDFGYNGTIKVSSHNPLVAYIQNNGPAFTGELQIAVDDNMGGKMMIATAFEMAQNSNKEISLDVPVYIIQKKFNVTIASNKKILYEGSIKAQKVLSPNQRVMAVITDTPDAYRFLENTKTHLVDQDPYMDKNVTNEVYQAVETEEIEVLYFDRLDALDSLDQLSYFNYIYMGHNQSLTISAEEEERINDWIKAGNCFVIETGADYQKMNSILPSSLNPLPITEVKNVMLTNIWEDLSLDQNIDVAIAKDTDKANYFYQQEGEAMIGAVTQVEKGSILTLMVNMGLEPMASWNSKAPLMSEILQEIGIQSTGIATDYYGDSSYQNILSQVPVDKKTPYVAMLIIFILYILLVAPISYIILKKIDKRDLAWIGIPIMAILCVATLYIMGGNTRYTKAISNSVSILSADEQSEFMNIHTEMNIFNNLNDHLKVEWNNNEKIDFNYSQSEMGYMGGYYMDQNSTAPKELTGKLTLGSPMKFEKYNASLWTASFLTAEKVIPFENSEKMMHMALDGSKVLIKVKNTTPFALIDTFIQWGQAYIMIGDLNPGDEKEISKDFSTFTSLPFETFIQNEMGLTRYDYSNKLTERDMTSQRKYDLLMQRYGYNNQTYYGVIATQSDFGNIKLCAMNTQDIGYEILVNGDETENYSTNIIEVSSELEFEAGSIINIPTGIITPETTYYLDEALTKIGSYEYQPNDQYLRFYEQGLASFTYTVPKGIQLSGAHIQFSEVYAEQDYYNVANGVAASPKEGILYSVYNVKEEAWEMVDTDADIDDQYVSSDGRIQIKIDLRTQQQEQSANSKADYSYVQMMKLPTISIEGSVQ